MTDPKQISRAIDELLADRAEDSTICPSEVARQLGGEDWRPLMEPVREVAASRAEEGTLLVTRRGTEVNARAPGGPIRLGRPSLRPDV